VGPRRFALGKVADVPSYIIDYYSIPRQLRAMATIR
jgi:hypothetical protein